MMLGAPSTNSLASFKPKPVASLTALTTLIFDDPAEVNSTSNSVFSAAASILRSLLCFLQQL